MQIKQCNGYTYTNGQRLMEEPEEPSKKEYEKFQDEL